jgi:hypothetical protein
MCKLIAAACLALVAALSQLAPALACGGLVAPDGDVRLDKATTFVAWHEGVEHYITSFAYSGSAADVGWIVPLPAVPTAITPAGRWTLQRLEREFAPPVEQRDLAFASAALPSPVVIEQVQVEALDVTVLKGTGEEVVTWCAHNGFLLPAETRDHLIQYARGSPIFMAAKYNTSRAQQRGLLSGDGVPLLITMKTPQLWVPLEVLANDNAPVVADLFLLTDDPVRTEGGAFGFGSALLGGNVDGATGFNLVRQEPMHGALFQDLSSDRNMQWVPSSGWLSYLTLSAPSAAVKYDLSLSTDAVIKLAAFGTSPAKPLPPLPATPSPWFAVAAAFGVAAVVVYVVWRRSRFATSTGSMSSARSIPSTRAKK